MLLKQKKIDIDSISTRLKIMLLKLYLTEKTVDNIITTCNKTFFYAFEVYATNSRVWALTWKRYLK